MTREEIIDAVCDIMMNDGPDGHTDGADVIADFVIACMDNKAEAWLATYNDKLAHI